MHLQHSPLAAASPLINFDDFLRVDIRIGTILKAEGFPEAKKPAYILTIDFGDGVGIKRSSTQITEAYSIDGLPGKQVAAVVNFPPRQVGKVLSEVLTLGFANEKGHVILFSPDTAVPNGSRLF